ncbi:hypothetical protein H0H92_006168 [Tricholoma furcatifolium]|nr:hypothetical protein H0H92_006168 [Tricholoma furcatifolium]
MPPPCTPDRAGSGEIGRSFAAASSLTQAAVGTVQESCDKMGSLLSDIKKRHYEKIASVEIKLREAQEKAEKLEEEVTVLRHRVQDLETKEAEKQEDDDKLRVALAEIERLREHSRAVGQYLINHSVKPEDEDSVTQPEVKDEVV